MIYLNDILLVSMINYYQPYPRIGPLLRNGNSAKLTFYDVQLDSAFAKYGMLSDCNDLSVTR